MRLFLIILLCLSRPAWADCVVLLHGLARTEASLLVLEESLEARDYQVVRPGYPSTSASVEDLADAVLPAAWAKCARPVRHVVTHSMGGILLRSWIARQGPLDGLTHVVMLAPPNQGSEVVDVLDDLEVFGWVNGPAGAQLGTEAESLPRRLPPVSFSLGVIAGNQSLNPYFSSLLPGADDGKVSVTATAVAGMADHITLPVTHTFMMNNPTVLTQVAHFLEHGKFDDELTWARAIWKQLGGFDDARD